MNPNNLKTSLLFVFIAFLLFSLPVKANTQTIRIGFVPGKSTYKLIRDWNFLSRHLINETDIPIKLIIKDNYTDVYNDFLNKRIDIVEGGALLQATILNTGLSKIIAAQKRYDRTQYHSIILVRKDSQITTLNDLKNKTFAFTDKLSTSGYLLPRIIFEQANIKDLNNFFSKIYMSGSHDRAIQMLANKQVDGIAIADFFYEYWKDKIKNQFTVLAISDAYPLGPITCRKDLNPEVVQKIQKALLNLNKKIPFEVFYSAGLNGFELPSKDIFNKIKQLPELAKGLKPIKTEETPQEIQFIFDEQITSLKKQILLFLIIPTLIFLNFLAFIIFTQQKGSVKRYFATSVFIPISMFAILQTCIVFFLATTQIQSNFNDSLNIFNKFESELKATLTLTQTPPHTKIHQFIQNNALFSAIRIYRENTYVADSTGLSMGKSIIDNVLSNTFKLSKNPHLNEFEIIEPIWLNDKIWGNKQILITIDPIKKFLNKAYIIHTIILCFFLILGIVLFLAVARTVKKPMEMITNTIKKLKTRDLQNDTLLNKNPASENLTLLANEFTHMSEDIVEQQTFLELKHLSFAQPTSKQSNNGLDTDLQQKIKTQIEDLENKHPEFKTLRQNELIGKSPEFLKTLMDAIIRSKDNDPVLIYGPTGSGKTGIAKAIHKLSPRRESRFGEFNCAEFASADPLIVLGKLFGYGKNSGIQGIPKEGQKGLLEEFNGSTIFLDEVELIPHQAQRLLLLPLERRPFNPAAGTGKPKQVNIRFIFATNVPLTQTVQEGLIRPDFYRRVNARGTINIAPLAYRAEDIPALAHHFLNQWNRANNKNLSFSNETLDGIIGASYNQYNISELKSLITIAADRALFAGKSIINKTYFPHTQHPTQEKQASLPQSTKILFDETEEKELAILRKHNFKFSLAEKELGYSSKAKTLTNHFRGICYKAMAEHIKKTGLQPTHNDFILIATSFSNALETDKTTIKIANKLQMFYDRVKLIKKENSNTLTKNLPSKYTQYVNILYKN